MRMLRAATLALGAAVLKEMGLDEEGVADTVADVRRRDEQRLEAQIAGGLTAGRSLLRGNMPTPEPEPYIKPRREGQPLSQETAAVLADDDEPGGS